MRATMMAGDSQFQFVATEKVASQTRTYEYAFRLAVPRPARSGQTQFCPTIALTSSSRSVLSVDWNLARSSTEYFPAGSNRRGRSRLDETRAVPAIGSVGHRSLYLREGHSSAKHEREVTFHGGIFPRGVKLHRAQADLYNCSRSNSARKTSCRSLRASRDCGMDLPELRDQRAIYESRAERPGMEILGGCRS